MPEPAPPFLGVAHSFTGKRWRLRLTDDRAGLALAQRLGIPEIVGRVLAARGVGPETADRFLEPTLRDCLPDPSHLRDMDAAAGRLSAAVAAGEEIAVFGDYDVDGATSAALLIRFLTAAGGKARAYIPDRRREGYGPNAPALARLKSEGAALVVTVDCGTLAHEPLAEAARLGLDVIVIDHHEAEPELPDALAVVNPNRLDETSPHKDLAAVGVAFLLAVAVNRELRRRGWYGDSRPEPDLMAWLDLVALGTICDVVPLRGLNRALVAQGLKVLAARTNTGLAALADAASLQGRVGAYHAAYMLGPRVNAGGRVGEADLGVRLLITQDAEEARRIAARLDAFNTERRRIEADVLARAEMQAAGSGAPLVLAAGEGWHVGVIGIVASRLKERFGRPACVVGFENGIGKGSGRSVPGIDLGAAVIAARQKGLLVNGGGHAMAAGFTVAEDKLAALRDFLDARIESESAAAPRDPSLGLDGALTPEAVTRGLATELERVGPFGTGNAEPRFAFAAVRLAHVEPAGEHLRCVLAGAHASLKGIAFRAASSDLGRELLRLRGAAVHVAGRIERDDWRGREGVQVFIDDAAPAAPG